MKGQVSGRKKCLAAFVRWRYVHRRHVKSRLFGQELHCHLHGGEPEKWLVRQSRLDEAAYDRLYWRWNRISGRLP